MSTSRELVREARVRADLTQRELAEAAGTSGSTIAAYESGTKQPRADTLVRIVGAAGAELELAPARSRNHRFVDLMCRRLAEEVAANPGVIAEARAALIRLEGRSPWVDAWRRLLDAGPVAVIGLLTSQSPYARPLKTDTPLAFVVDIPEADRAKLLEAAHAT